MSGHISKCLPLITSELGQANMYRIRKECRASVRFYTPEDVEQLFDKEEVEKLFYFYSDPEFYPPPHNLSEGPLKDLNECEKRYCAWMTKRFFYRLYAGI